MRKKKIISLVCLLIFLGITTYCFVNSKTDISEQVLGTGENRQKVSSENRHF